MLCAFYLIQDKSKPMPLDDTINLQVKNGYYTFHTLPGKIYSIILKTNDTVPAGKIFDTEAKLKTSPLGRMFKKAFIIKADDLTYKVSDKFKKFTALIEECDAKAALGIIGRHINKTLKGADWLHHLDKDRFELFFHGWTHDISPNFKSDQWAEFKNRGYKRQSASITKGIKAGKKYLGHTFHTFGPPGNAFDRNTQKAVLANPDIKIWFHGIEDSQNRYFVLELNMELEYGGKESSDELIKRYETQRADEIITVQLHPKNWKDNELQKLRKLLAHINADPERRFVTPWEYYCWMNDWQNILLTKTSDKEYVLDMAKSQYPHLIEFQSDTAISVNIK